jgi:hypothetical protein
MICSLLLANCGNFDDASPQDKPGINNPVKPGDEGPNEEVDPPVTNPPVTEPPETEPPETEPPETEPPETEPPVTEPPVTEPPVTEPPVTEPPVTEPPVTEPPVTNPPVTNPPVTEPPVIEPPVTEPPVTNPPETEPPGSETETQETETENIPILRLNEIGNIIWNPNPDIPKRNSFETILINQKANEGKVLKFVVYMANEKQYTRNLKNTYLPLFEEDAKIHILNTIYQDDWPDNNPVLSKTCIVAIMDGSKYIDAVCLKETPSLQWSDEYMHFQEIMEKLNHDKVWKSKEDRIPDYRDCVDTSSITSYGFSIQRREESNTTHTAADWYKEKETLAYPNKQ